MKKVIIAIISVMFFAIILMPNNKQITWTKITVNQGDTLEQIVKDNCDGDIRKNIFEIKKHNNLKDFIYPGQEIEIPCKEEIK